jgi:hypothetical protein
MKRHELESRALVALLMLTAAAGTARAAGITEPQAAMPPTSELIARVERVTPGGRQFQVIDRRGNHLQVVQPARPPQASRLERDGDLVNASALREGDIVQVTGVGHGDWFEARQVTVLTGARLGAATPAERVLRFTGFDGGRELRAVGADGTEYRIILPARPQAVTLWKAGSLANLSALAEGDPLVPHGAAQDHVIRADWLEVLGSGRIGSGADVPLRLTYRGSAGWRTLIGEAVDGTRYSVALPRRPQAFYLIRDGAWVEPSALRPGDTMEVYGVPRGEEIEASRIVLR